MAIPVYAPHEIDGIERAAEVVSRAIDAALAGCVDGTTTREVSAAAERVLAEAGAEPLFPDQRDGGEAFGAVACVCVNDEVVHARPGDRALLAGGVVTVDVGARFDGWCADLARSTVVGGDGVGSDSERAPGVNDGPLLTAARDVLHAALGALKPGGSWSNVATAVRDRARSLGVYLIDGFCGHGIGWELHEPPAAKFVDPGPDDDFVLRPGMVFTLEPIVCTRPVGTVLDALGWTVRTRDGSPACYEERMVAITRSGPRVLG